MTDTDAFAESDYWRAIILYGLNAATYKMALGKVLLEFARGAKDRIPWIDLSQAFLRIYQNRLSVSEPLPQQGIPGRRTVMETTVNRLTRGQINLDQAVDDVGTDGLRDVIPRFQTLGHDKSFIGNRFYEFQFGKELLIKDSLFSLTQARSIELEEEIEARWRLLEGSYAIAQEDWALQNNVREIYLQSASRRRDLTTSIPFLQGYQGNSCFYCGEPIAHEAIHVDHLLPRQVVQHDEIWNLVLAHDFCNLSKSDRMVAAHYLEKLRRRNENIVGSSHPWRKQILLALGQTAAERRDSLQIHYDQVSTVLRSNPWGGIANYIPEHDHFFRRLITQLNNR